MATFSEIHPQYDQILKHGQYIWSNNWVDIFFLGYTIVNYCEVFDLIYYLFIIYIDQSMYEAIDLFLDQEPVYSGLTTHVRSKR